MVLSVLVGAFGVPVALHAQGNADNGKVVYDKWCAGCHGENGDGEGVAASYMLPRPRDFTRGVYQIRTTASGDLPTDADLRRMITEGMPGSTMPAWGEKLSAGQINDVIAYVKSFSRFFEGADPQPVEVGSPPRVTDETLAEGRRLYLEELQCNSCHGDAGRGNGTSAQTMTDDWGFPLRPADLEKNWRFNGGGTVEDVFWRMRTGVDGTPMPSNWDIVEAEIITEEQLWQVAQYVRSLSPEDPPRARDVIRVSLIQGRMPDGPDDPRWDNFERFWVPLVGQITVAPRQFVPTVDGVWVQALHNRTQMAMRVTWNDPTHSPDPDWEEFFRGTMAVMADVDGHPDEQGPDLLTLQFPVEQPEDMALPYFLGGDTQRPVWLARWSSTPDSMVEGQATELGGLVPSERRRTQFQHVAVYDDGQYRVQLVRTLASNDPARIPALPEGVNVPIAFRVADGTNGGGTVRGSISAWYSIYLDVPTPARVFIAPVLAALMTAAVGLVVVWRAQKTHQASGE